PHLPVAPLLRVEPEPRAEGIDGPASAQVEAALSELQRDDGRSEIEQLHRERLLVAARASEQEQELAEARSEDVHLWKDAREESVPIDLRSNRVPIGP